MTHPGGIGDSEVLRAVLAGAPVRVAVVDRSGRFLLDPDPNRALGSDVGAPPGRSFLEVYGDIPGIADALRSALAGEQVKLTRQRGGATYTTTFLPRRSPSGEVDAVFAVAVVSDDHTRVERALEELQTRERHVFNSNMMGLLYWSSGGAITDANDTFLNMVGYTRADLTEGRLDWLAMTPPEYLHLDEAALLEIRARGACTPFEKEYIARDGKRVAVLVGGSSWEPSGGAGVAFVVDISERKRSERARRETEATLGRVVEAAPIVLWSVDARGIFTLSMGRGLSAIGLAPGQVVGRSAFELYAQLPEVVAAIRRCLRGEEFSVTLHVAERTFETLFTPLRGGAGEVTGVLGVSIDVTERRHAEAEQERLRAQLLQVQKLESLGLLAGGIAHDFNNVLTAILGGASTALLTIAEHSPARRDIELVISAAQRAAALTRQMLAYSGKALVEIRPIDLSLHVREIATLLETTVPKKVQLRLELSPDLPSIEADVAQLQQVVMNLVINAAEAIGEQQGTVLVTTGVQEVAEHDASTLFPAQSVAPGRFVFVQVRDTGHGMDEATQSKIFDPFFTTKFTGRGLGLAAVLGIVRAHRGAIEVTSSLGGGTTFKVLFPAALASARVEPARSIAAYRGTGLVLVIDDDATVRMTARRMLEFFGFSVMEAEDGQSGAELFAAHAAEIVLAIVDMTMPRMNGEETVRAIRRARADVPVMLASGYSEVEATRRFTGEGLSGFLEKPFTPTDLAKKLAQILPRGR